jgi:four helix bundle protein
MKNSIILDKTFAFAVRIVKACKHLQEKENEFILTKQLIRCGTSVGANTEEAMGGQSVLDFKAKLSIAYKEAREVKYWLRLLHASDYLSQVEFESLFADIEEINKILYTIINTTKKSLLNK